MGKTRKTRNPIFLRTTEEKFSCWVDNQQGVWSPENQPVQWVWVGRILDGQLRREWLPHASSPQGIRADAVLLENVRPKDILEVQYVDRNDNLTRRFLKVIAIEEDGMRYVELLDDFE